MSSQCRVADSRITRPTRRWAGLLYNKLSRLLHVMAPTLLALAFASAGSGVAHAQGTMDFSGAQTLMGTFKTFAIYAGAVICFGGLIFAGIRMMSGRFHDTSPEVWNSLMDTNLRAPYLMIRGLAPLMIEARSGQIINISSLAGRNPVKGAAAYSASKWGLNGLTYSVAEELREYGIRVSVIAPGSVNSGFSSLGTNEAEGGWKIQPDDIAEAVALLVSQSPTSFISEVLLRPAQRKP
jgi:NAD(P)-dependent dehydrogenase (short-subunit alcohol dehydrogenase family)